METNQTNSQWQNKPQVKKGNIGEQIVKEYLEGRGFNLYKSITEGGHAFDILAVKNKEQIMIAEIKTKPRLNYYPATGFNIVHYETYKKISAKHNLEVFVFFVDEMMGQVYGNYLKFLENPAVVNGKQYPMKMGDVIVFPLDNMIPIKSLDEEQINHLKQLNTRNYDYLTKDELALCATVPPYSQSEAVQRQGGVPAGHVALHL